ncbi:MAG: twin-arginine translocase TatA/TatE family subunit [Pirellulaceae bacterium]
MSPSALSWDSLVQCAVLGWYPGPFELLIIGGVALLLFGHRLPSVMRSLGRGVVEFKKGVQGVDDEEESGAGGEGITTHEKTPQKT